MGRQQKKILTPNLPVLSTIELAESLYKTPSLVSHKTRCGRSNCRCARGELHGPYWYLYWREGTVQRRRYVRPTELPAVRALCERRRAQDHHDRLLLRLARHRLSQLRTFLL